MCGVFLCLHRRSDPDQPRLGNQAVIVQPQSIGSLLLCNADLPLQRGLVRVFRREAAHAHHQPRARRKIPPGLAQVGLRLPLVAIVAADDDAFAAARDLPEIDAKEPSANASGFFISADGLAVTNYHSIEDSIYATATLATGEVYPVKEVLYYDTAIDIAVLRISQTSTAHETASAFAYLELVGTGDIRSGDTVYTLGNPLGLGLAVSSGIISSPAREVERYALPCVMNTADISRGSSGGALLNVYGQVIAITSGAYTYGNNMYLAVPADPVMETDLTVPGKTLAEVVKLESAKEEN